MITQSSRTSDPSGSGRAIVAVNCRESLIDPLVADAPGLLMVEPDEVGSFDVTEHHHLVLVNRAGLGESDEDRLWNKAEKMKLGNWRGKLELLESLKQINERLRELYPLAAKKPSAPRRIMRSPREEQSQRPRGQFADRFESETPVSGSSSTHKTTGPYKTATQAIRTEANPHASNLDEEVERMSRRLEDLGLSISKGYIRNIVANIIWNAKLRATHSIDPSEAVEGATDQSPRRSLETKNYKFEKIPIRVIVREQVRVKLTVLTRQATTTLPALLVQAIEEFFKVRHGTAVDWSVEGKITGSRLTMILSTRLLDKLEKKTRKLNIPRDDLVDGILCWFLTNRELQPDKMSRVEVLH